MAGEPRENKVTTYIQQDQVAIAVNSLIVKPGQFLRIASGFIDLSGVGQRIDGVSHTLKTYSATNQTVEKELTLYKANNGSHDETYDVEVTNGTLTQADVGSFFSMAVDQTLDAATVSATVGVYLVISINTTGTIAEVALTKQGS